MAKGKYIECKTTVADALSDAGSIVTELHDEMSAWRDSLEDKFSSTEKYQMVSDAADTLENCEMEEKCERLTELLEELGEGRDAKPGCDEHVIGRACYHLKKCKWDGIAKKPWGKKLSIARHDPPITTTAEWEVGGKKKMLTDTYFGSIGNQYWTVREPSTDAERAKTLAAFLVAEKETIGYNASLDRPLITAKIPPIAKVFPVKGLEELDGRKCVYREFRAYKHTSRAARLENATVAAHAAIEVLEAALEKFEESVDERVSVLSVDDIGDDTVDARIHDVKESIKDIEEAIGELEGVEFPGMFG